MFRRLDEGARITSKFFRGWRRKAGCVTLVAALAFTIAWGRSITKIDRFTIQADYFTLNRIVSFNGGIARQKVVPIAPSDLVPTFDPLDFERYAEIAADDALSELIRHNDQTDWKYRYCGFCFDERLHGPDENVIFHFYAVQVKTWKLSYWLLIIPLMLISAYLLLGKPRKAADAKANS